MCLPTKYFFTEMTTNNSWGNIEGFLPVEEKKWRKGNAGFLILFVTKSILQLFRQLKIVSIVTPGQANVRDFPITHAIEWQNNLYSSFLAFRTYFDTFRFDQFYRRTFLNYQNVIFFVCFIFFIFLFCSFRNFVSDKNDGTILYFVYIKSHLFVILYIFVYIISSYTILEFSNMYNIFKSPVFK